MKLILIALWGRILSILNRFTHKPIEQARVAEAEAIEKRETAQAKVRDLTRYRWVTIGYNRHERRGMAKRLDDLVRQYPDKDRSLTVPPKIKAEIALLKFKLTNGEKNPPAVHDQTNNPLYWRGVRQAV